MDDNNAYDEWRDSREEYFEIQRLEDECEKARKEREKYGSNTVKENASN